MVKIASQDISKTELAERLGISRGMLYYQHKRPILDEEIKRQIETVLVTHKAYGHKRIAPELKMNKKRILRVMKKYGIKPYRRITRKPKKKEDAGKAAEKDSVNIYKLLCPIAPNIIWVSDFTYIKYRGRFIYAATIMDMYTREIIGIAISRFHNQNLVMEAFMDAEKKTGTRHLEEDSPLVGHPLYLHSDQGSEYTSEDYKMYVKDKGIIISYSDKASPWQNGFQESFYGKFKVDLGSVDQFKALGELIDAIYHTIHYYNNDRRHTGLKNMTPLQFKNTISKKSFQPIV